VADRIGGLVQVVSAREASGVKEAITMVDGGGRLAGPVALAQADVISTRRQMIPDLITASI
jgi:hypothetical protein